MSAFPYAPVLIASERQQPMTAAEWAGRNDRVAEFIRDVPSSCSGAWTWEPGLARFALIGHTTGCPWHTGAPGRMP